MPGLLCPAVPHGWREVGGSAVWRHPTCNVKVSLKDDFFIGTPDRSSLSHGHVHMLSLCTDFCSGFDIFMYFLTASSAILLLTSQVTIWIRVRITYARFWLSFTLEFIVFCKFFCCVNVITGYWSCLFFVFIWKIWILCSTWRKPWGHGILLCLHYVSVIIFARNTIST